MLNKQGVVGASDCQCFAGHDDALQTTSPPPRAASSSALIQCINQHMQCCERANPLATHARLSVHTQPISIPRYPRKESKHAHLRAHTQAAATATATSNINVVLSHLLLVVQPSTRTPSSGHAGQKRHLLVWLGGCNSRGEDPLECIPS